jgi:hypothetical protein
MICSTIAILPCGTVLFSEKTKLTTSGKETPKNRARHAWDILCEHHQGVCPPKGIAGYVYQTDIGFLKAPWNGILEQIEPPENVVLAKNKAEILLN